MVDIKTAIMELNTGVIDFIYNDSGRTTEGEVVILLKELERYQNTGLEPDEIKANKWIPIGEKLPVEGERVWVTVELHGGDRRVEEATYIDSGFRRDIGMTYLDLIARAWMPRYVPKPYQEAN